jgi:hypothetical protein
MLSIAELLGLGNRIIADKKNLLSNYSDFSFKGIKNCKLVFRNLQAVIIPSPLPSKIIVV